MGSRRMLARLPLVDGDKARGELVLSEWREPGAAYVRFETSRLDPETKRHDHIRRFIAIRELRGAVLKTATEDFVRRYLHLVVRGRFQGDRRAAMNWLLERATREVIRGAS